MASTSDAPRWCFHLVGEGVGVGTPVPKSWRSLSSLPLLIAVGVTGVGKTTTLAALQRQLPRLQFLPERRILTDRCIIPVVWDERQQRRPPDRLERLACTRRFREHYRGGMAEVLGQLSLDERLFGGSVVYFDGLRGVDAVAHAISHLPRARFAALTAPDMVRLGRLLGRRDRFDQVRAEAGPGDGTTGSLAARSHAQTLRVPGMEAIFSVAEQAAVSAMIGDGAYSAAEVRSKLAIVVEERQSYDPVATNALLREQAGERSVIVDTVGRSPAQVAARLIEFLQASDP
jgi:hypothetical protein